MLTHLPRSSVPGIGFPALPATAACHHLAMQYQLEASQWQPAETILQRQLAQLKILADHARQTVPYYQKLFESQRLATPPDLTLEFFRTLPISRREMIQQAGETLRSRKLPAEHGKLRQIATSGSTGRPVRLQSTAITRFFWEAFVLREHAWHRRDVGRKLAVIRWAERNAGAAPDGLHAAMWPTINLVSASGPSCMLNVATPLTQQIEWLLREQPRYLLSYPSNVAALAAHCLEHRITLPGLAEVRTIGEMLTQRQRALCEQAWGAKVVDLYSCEEAGYLALQCPEHNHYHVQSENVFLEIVDHDGNPCAPGQAGRVLVTTLHNFATPLIRYELGDFAQFGVPCSCGRGLPVIDRIHGRTRNRLILPDGRSEFPYLGEHGQIQKATGVRVLQYQLVQHSTEQVELRLATDRDFTLDELGKVRTIVQTNLGHPFEVTVTRMAEVPKGPTGKFEEFVSHAAS